MHAFVTLGFVFPYQAKRLALGTSPKWPILCWVGCKTRTQSTLTCWRCHMGDELPPSGPRCLSFLSFYDVTAVL